MNDARYIDSWRRQKSRSFDLYANSTGKLAVELKFWGQPAKVYTNANLSIYSAQACNAKCAFCVEELRPASRGTALQQQKTIEKNDSDYFRSLESVLAAVAPLAPSISVTGGEPSKDVRLPRILDTLRRFDARKLTLTTNGSGLLDCMDGRRVIDCVAQAGAAHLNISRAHMDHERNARLMRFRDGLRIEQLRGVIRTASEAGTRVRLSCVLLAGEIDSVQKIIDYLAFAQMLGVDNVIFRQLMLTDPDTVARNFVVRYSDRKRVKLEAVLDKISTHPEFSFQRQIMGYYYYVEVWKYAGMDVVFEEADLAQLETVKRANSDIVHELIFHPNGKLASTWQPWDGILGPMVPNRPNALRKEIMGEAIPCSPY